MATSALRDPADVVERNLRLTRRITQFLLDNPELFRSLPDQFELVILPDDDPEIRAYNLELLDRHGSADRPIVFARMTAHADTAEQPPAPSLFVPVAA